MTDILNTTDFPDLIKRLRGKYSLGGDGVIREDRDFGTYTPQINNDAADAIEALVTELERSQQAYAELNEKFFELKAWTNDLEEWVRSLVEKSEKTLSNFDPYDRLAKSAHIIIKEQVELLESSPELSLKALKTNVVSAIETKWREQIDEDESYTGLEIFDALKHFADNIE